MKPETSQATLLLLDQNKIIPAYLLKEKIIITLQQQNPELWFSAEDIRLILNYSHKITNSLFAILKEPYSQLERKKTNVPTSRKKVFVYRFKHEQKTDIQARATVTDSKNLPTQPEQPTYIIHDNSCVAGESMFGILNLEQSPQKESETIPPTESQINQSEPQIEKHNVTVVVSSEPETPTSVKKVTKELQQQKKSLEKNITELQQDKQTLIQQLQQLKSLQQEKEEILNLQQQKQSLQQEIKTLSIEMEMVATQLTTSSPPSPLKTTSPPKPVHNTTLPIPAKVPKVGSKNFPVHPINYMPRTSRNTK